MMFIIVTFLSKLCVIYVRLKMKPNLFDVIKSKLIEYKIITITTKRDRELAREEIKAGKFPIFLLLIIIAFISALAIIYFYDRLMSYENNVQVLIILILQTIVIGFQLWVMYAQTRNEKMSNLPEFYIETESIRIEAPLIKHTQIYLKNIGQTAHQVSFKIKATKRGESLQIVSCQHILFTFKHEDRKPACTLLTDEYNNKKIRIDLTYFDKRGKYNEAKFIKLAGEQEFNPIFTGLE
jgi:hypothetical protein